MVVGDSGSGKSSSFRNLPPGKTVVLNTERKVLPFREFSKFKNININKYKDYVKVIKELKSDEKYDFVVIDSLTSLLEICNKYCETVYSGYNIWSEYNSMVYSILQDIKDLPQQVFITAIPEHFDDGQGSVKAFAKTKGKEFKYSMEKEFAIVLHTHLEEDDDGSISAYQLDTRPSKHTSSKSPSGMFDERYIDNDMMLVTGAIDAYYS